MTPPLELISLSVTGELRTNRTAFSPKACIAGVENGPFSSEAQGAQPGLVKKANTSLSAFFASFSALA